MSELRRLDAGGWRGPEHAGARVPSLAEALATLLPRAIPMIERKGGAPGDLIALLRSQGWVEQVLVQAFDWDFLREVRALEPRIAIGALCEQPLTRGRLDAIRTTGACFVHWDHADLAAEDVAELHARGYLVCVYTANTDVELAGAAALGIDMITTNRPARLLALRERQLGR
jgi:glycerophosphoryl diester phosphodiesterase